LFRRPQKAARKKNFMIEITIHDEFIKLGQAMKLAHLVENGGEAKEVIQKGKVRVNGEKEEQRGKKLHVGDIVEYNGETIKVR